MGVIAMQFAEYKIPQEKFKRSKLVNNEFFAMKFNESFIYF